MAFMEFGPAVGAAGAEGMRDFNKSVLSTYSHQPDQNQESPFDRTAFGFALISDRLRAKAQSAQGAQKETHRPRRHRLPPLSAEEELDLLRRWQTERHQPSRDKLVRLLEPACRKFIATRYRLPANRRAADLEAYDDFNDLLQEGLLGVEQALNTYKPDGGKALTTWALDYARGRIFKWFQAERRRLRHFERMKFPCDEDGKEGDNVPIQEAAHAAATFGCCAQGPRGQLVGGSQFQTEPEPDDSSADLTAALATLSPRERKVVERHDLQEPRRTFAEIGREIGASGESARQLYERAIGKMRTLALGQKITGVKATMLDLLSEPALVQRKYLSRREVSELRVLDRDLGEVVGDVQAGLKGAAFLRWKETRPTANDAAARLPVASACEECGKAFKAAAGDKFCAAECKRQDLQREVLRAVVQQLDRRFVDNDTADAAAQVAP
jgi:RNA polymerase sigma factor (sigma-70 family)